MHPLKLQTNHKIVLIDGAVKNELLWFDHKKDELYTILPNLRTLLKMKGLKSSALQIYAYY